MEEGTIKELMTSAKCSGCKQHYEVDNIDVLGHHEDLWFVSVFCPSCRIQYVVAAVVDGEEVSEAVTDLSSEELERFQDAGRLTADEVLDMHNFLQEFDGDFSRFFGEVKDT